MLLAARALPKFFPMLMTAAGTIAPATVLVLGAGVAGLQAIGTARRLGAVVEAFDVRKVVKEQVESLGAKFVEVEASEDAQTAGGYAKEVSRGVQEEAGRGARAPRRQGRRRASAPRSSPASARPSSSPTEMVQRDAARARSSSISRPSRAATASSPSRARPSSKHGVTIIGAIEPAEPTSRVHASQMYSRNMEKLLVPPHARTARSSSTRTTRSPRGCVITHGGEIVHARVSEALATARRSRVMPHELVFGLYIFVLADVRRLPGHLARSRTLLHTPLMAGTNAIAGISLVGSLVAAGGELRPRRAPSSASSP